MNDGVRGCHECFPLPLRRHRGWCRCCGLLQVLGTPTREEIRAMNSNYSEFKFPQIKAHPWKGVFRARTPPEVCVVKWIVKL